MTVPLGVPNSGPVFLCTTCHHHHGQHQAAGRCQVTVARGWDGREFTNYDACTCERYVGVAPNHHGCPHEWLKESTNCVRCGTVKASR